jgi:hypothetical protein
MVSAVRKAASPGGSWGEPGCQAASPAQRSMIGFLISLLVLHWVLKRE